MEGKTQHQAPQALFGPGAGLLARKHAQPSWHDQLLWLQPATGCLPQTLGAIMPAGDVEEGMAAFCDKVG